MRIVLAMLLLGAEPGPISFADASFTLVPLRAEDLPPERVVQMALDFLRAVGLLVQEPPGLLELGQWRSYGWRIPRMWRLGWGPPHWPRTIEVALNARSGELIRYNSADAEDYTYQANRRGDPPQIGSQWALELAQYYLKASGGVSVPMVFDGVYVSVGSYFPVAQGPWQAWKAVRRATGATGVEVLGRARRDLSRLREVEIQRWMLEGACSRPRLIASLRLSAREAVWRRLLAAVRRGRWGGNGDRRVAVLAVRVSPG